MGQETVEEYIGKTKKWVEKIVVGLNLCPFAKSPFLSDKIRYKLVTDPELKTLLEVFVDELKYLKNASPKEVETTLLIHPHILTSFDDYNNTLPVFEGLLNSMGLEGIIQIASFHPDYQFAETEFNDVENYTNRSPFPMLHLIREDSISQAVDHYPDIDEIPNRNIEKMNELGMDKIKDILKHI